MFAFGVVLFALGILASVAWHECGHMWAARATGMKVRRYFVGFGPKIWSITRGETEYGLKAIPAGGFCDIAGMTTMDELTPDEEDRAMWKQKPWKRIFVLAAGPAMNFVLGIVLLYAVTLTWGLPGMSHVAGAAVYRLDCVAPTQLSEKEFAPCAGQGPAERAGMKPWDVITAVNGAPVSNPDAAVKAIAGAGAGGSVRFDVLRDGQKLSFEVAPEHATWFDIDPVAGKYRYDPATGKPVLREMGKVGVRLAPTESIITQYNPATAIPATFTFTGVMLEKTWEGVEKIPSKVGALVHSLGGGARDPETPMSVVGASRIGGELAEHHEDGGWPTFVLLLASLNFVLGLLNLFPLVPFDGGHIAVVCYEKVRDSIRRLRGKEAGAPVDYLKLAPATYVVLAVVGVYMVLVLAADVINPIHLF